MDANEIMKLFRTAVREAIEEDRLEFGVHAREMMESRGITEDEVRAVLLENDPHEFFPPYSYPHGENPFSNQDPIFAAIGNNNIVVVVAMRRKRFGVRFYVVTAFFASEQSRHRKRGNPPPSV